MFLRVLFSVLVHLTEAKFCQSEAPTASLLEELRLCRELNYPFCIEASFNDLMKAKQQMQDLDNEVANSARREASALAVVADRYLVSRINYMFTTTAPSQTCAYYWRLSLCAEVFSPLVTYNSNSTPCIDTCAQVLKYCGATFLSDACAARLEAGAETEKCVDYAQNFETSRDVFETSRRRLAVFFSETSRETSRRRLGDVSHDVSPARRRRIE